MIQKKKARSSIKGQMTRLANYIIENPNATEIELKIRLDSLSELYARFNHVQDEIDQKCSEEEQLIEDAEERIPMETKYFDTQAKYISAIEKFHQPNQNVPATNDNPQINQNAQMKLPPITLPKFDGSVSEWHTFLDTFSSLINNDPHIDLIKKFHYLKSCLTGEAANLIDSITVTAANYENAWTLLKERYNNKKLLINHHLKGFFSQTALKSENFSDLNQLFDTSNKHLRALRALGSPVDQWDDITVFLITSKFDYESKRQWDMSLKENEMPSFKDLEQFIQKRCFALSNISQDNMGNQKNKGSKTYNTHHSESKAIKLCNFCSSKEHKSYKCPDMIKLNPKERFELVKRKNLCLKCFNKGHSLSACRLPDCNQCAKKHNSLLHFNQVEDNPEQLNVHAACFSGKEMVLATSLVRIKDKDGNYLMCRALLDPGAESNFVTAKTADRLGVKWTKTNICISGVNQVSFKTSKTIDFEISSPISSFKNTYSFLILNKITNVLPSKPVCVQNWTFLDDFSLADPGFAIPEKIDILLGVEPYEDVVMNEVFKPSRDLPTLRKTVFGWVVSGKITSSQTKDNEMRKIVVCHSIAELSNSLTKFWEIEEIVESKSIPVSFCEEYFLKTFVRLNSGRIQVTLPFNPAMVSHKLGESRSKALRLLQHMERKMKNDPNFGKLYINFMHEYLNLSHMELIPLEQIECSPMSCYYLPHHAVMKESSKTTKLRVVFNASSRSSSGFSLNDLLALGPQLQDDLFSLICRFRLYPIALTADIEKMYRQILLSPEDRDFHRILWRDSPSEPVREYRLKTVTYGTKPASFLAVRALHQIAKQSQEKFPTASKVILRDFYMDDLITGCFTLEEALKLQNDLIEVTRSGCMSLRQWCSNKLELIENLPEHLVEKISFSECKEQSVKTLGLLWFPREDYFTFSHNELSRKFTKRDILSNISKIFDPLGFLAPITVNAKVFMQGLWLCKIDWDKELDEQFKGKWESLLKDFFEIRTIKLKRYISEILNPRKYDLHVFSDASQSAYAAVVYIVSEDGKNNKFSKLLCAKTRVAPLKPVTIPKLELCSAVLAVRLTLKIIQSLSVNIGELHFWLDSQIALCWLASPARDWKVFVSNRVAFIQENLKSLNYAWHYVPSKENPADIASRGCSSKYLKEAYTWWNGPKWLVEPESKWPEVFDTTKISEKIERRVHTVSLFSVKDDYIIDRFSSYPKIIRVFSYVFRFLKRLRGESLTEFITNEERNKALGWLLVLHQKKNFEADLIKLRSGKPLSRGSSILQLSPFIDKRGILRVGGRLQNSQISFGQKHPILLHKNDQLTNCLIDYIHKKYFHAGPQLMRSTLSQQFWILNAKSAIKKRIFNCTTCIRFKGTASGQIMGNLPPNRIVPSRPFTNCGVDYAGPILTKRFKGRCNSIEKSYVAIFVCFATKAVHFELISDLTDEGFIAGLKRFIARRGRPLNIYSDNGRNFVGAKNKFDDLYRFLSDDSLKLKLGNFVASECMNWHFIPPYAPHMGGLWEAAVKSMKNCLKILTKEIRFTFEELYTILTQIESSLNSRPLTELSNDPNDICALTPGHFLIGGPLNSLPEEDLLNMSVNLNKRWDIIKRISQQFWNRWTHEYLNSLQSRLKWKIKKPNLRVNDLVIIKNEFNSPGKWPLARVTKVHPGNDGVVRVVTLRTLNGLITRAIHGLIPLVYSVDSVNGGSVREFQ